MNAIQIVAPAACGCQPQVKHGTIETLKTLDNPIVNHYLKLAEIGSITQLEALCCAIVGLDSQTKVQQTFLAKQYETIQASAKLTTP